MVRRVLYPAVTVTIVLVAWHLATVILDLPEYLLPSPLVIAQTAVDTVPRMSEHARVTAIEVGLGYGAAILLALPIAVMITWFRGFQDSVYPLLVASQTIPKVAIAPLFVVWFGFSTTPKVLIVVMISFFPIVISAVVGLQSVDRDTIQLLRSMGASRWQLLRKLQFPNALPSLFGGLKVAISLAVVGAVVGEFVGSNSGLGYVLLQATGQIDTPRLFTGVAWLMAMGITLFYAVTVIEQRVTAWREDTGSQLRVTETT